MYKLIFIIIINITLSGCVGFMVAYSSEDIYKSEKVTPSTAIKGDCCNDTYYDFVATKSGIKTIWGNPDEVINDGKTEKWKYVKSALLWAGVFPIIIFPIPIALPIGHEYTIIAFDGDNVISAETKTAKTYIAVCGIFLSDASANYKMECHAD